jgi:hypothetical protein
MANRIKIIWPLFFSRHITKLPCLLRNSATKALVKSGKLRNAREETLSGQAHPFFSEALKALKENKITGYIPNFGLYKPNREGFRYFPKGDYYKCSRGVKLPFKRLRDSHDGACQMKVYRSSSLDCRHCPLSKACIRKSDFKKIEDTVDKPLYDEMHERLQTPKARRMKKLRQATVEPVIGTLVNFLGMRRVNTREIKLANKCLLMAAALVVEYHIARVFSLSF